jgi:di/tricarboxylate transporter
MPLGTDALLTGAVIALLIAGLVRELLSPDVLVLAALAVLMVAGVVSPEEAFAGFSSPAVLTVGALFVVAGALSRTGAMHRASRALLGGARHPRQALLRLLSVSSLASAFLNNTPIVAMLLPPVMTWCRQRAIAPSKLLIPLSYAAIVGGVCTLFGTSTNLLVSNLLEREGLPPFEVFELGWVGIPCAVVAIAYLVAFAPWLLPARGPTLVEASGDPREYLIEMRLEAHSPLVGRTVEQAGLRHLAGLFLVRIERATGLLSPVSPHERLAADDVLSFAGALETIVDLQQLSGLVPAERQRKAAGRWSLHEAVVSPASPLVGTSIRDANFRNRYGAAVLAVHRHGDTLHGKLGDVVLRPGDTLLLEAAVGFARSFRNAADFYLISAVEDSEAPRYQRSAAALAVLAGVVITAGLGWLPIALAALVGAIAVIALRCLTPSEARGSVDASVLLVLAGSLGIARAVEVSGLADAFAGALVAASAGLGPLAVLAAVYVATMLLTELITNGAAAALVFPVALAAATQVGAEPRAFAVAVAVAASLSLATPLGYQTNLMVWAPGGYRFHDFLRVGLPLQCLLAGVALLSIYGFFGV